MKATNLAIATAIAGGFPIGIATGIDWQKADLRSAQGQKDVVDAVNAYFKDIRGAAQGRGMDPALAAALKAAFGEKTTRTGHIPGSLPTIPDIDVRFYGPAEDSGLMGLFRYVDKTTSKNPTYQFANVGASAIVFEQKKEGQPARLRKVAGGTPSSISSITWHGALGIDDEARRFDDYMIFEENVQRVPSIWNDQQVDVHAALITALGSGINETFSTAASASIGQRLIETLNAAGAQIIEDCGTVYGLGDSPALSLLYNHRDWLVVQQALISNFTLPNDNNSARRLQWQINPVQTRKIPQGAMYLALPGYDAVTVEWDPLYSEYGRDWARGTDAFVWRARRNAAIGNTEQFRRITLPAS